MLRENKFKLFSSKVLIILIISFFLFNFENAFSIENKIEFKVNNEIVTSIDIINEKKLLTL